MIYIGLQTALPILAFGIQGALMAHRALRQLSPVQLQISKVLR